MDMGRVQANVDGKPGKPGRSEVKKREEQILAHISMVRAIARELRNRLPWSLELDDLEGAGLLALTQAVDSYDPAHPKAVPIRIWIKYKVRGAILDTFRGRAYRWELHAPLADCHHDPSPPPEEGILHKEKLSLLACAIEQALSPKERATLRRALAGWRMASVGRQLHVTETAAYQIRKRAVVKVRAFLNRTNGQPICQQRKTSITPGAEKRWRQLK